MPLQVGLTKTNSKFEQCYEAEWIIKKPILDMGESLRSEPFAPIPGIPVQFCWEMWSHKSLSSDYKTATVYFKLTLVKLTYLDISPSLEIEVNVDAYVGSDVLKIYKIDTHEIFVQYMATVTVFNAKLECLNHERGHCENQTCYYDKMRANYFTIKSNLIFFDHLSSALTYSCRMRSLKTLEYFMKSFGAIYNDDLSSDLTILIGEKKLRAHKSILIAHSTVIKQMLEQDFAELKTNTLTIVDFDYDIFTYFLKFLYSGKIEDQSWLTVKQLYILANKYGVQTLQLLCSEILESLLSIDNLCETLKLAYKVGKVKNDLKRKAKQFAALNFKKLIRRIDWKKMVLSHPRIGYDIIAVHKC